MILPVVIPPKTLPVGIIPTGSCFPYYNQHINEVIFMGIGMKNILSEPDGSPITIVEMVDYVPYKRTDPDKCDKEVLFIIYKDRSNTKKVKAIVNPSIEFYMTKPEFRNDWKTPREYIDIDKTYPVKVPAKNVLNTIYKEAKKCDDPMSKHLCKVYDYAVNTGQWSARKEIFKWQHVFMADIGTEDYYRIMIGYHYNTNRDHTVSKCFLDIESDIYGKTTSETDANLDPTNAVTIIFDHDSITGNEKPQVYTLLLRDHIRYPQQRAFEQNMDKFIKQCHKEFDNIKVTTGGKTAYIQNVADYHIIMFDKESELLSSVFSLINRQRPDICAVWNIAYDLPKMYARMLRNGMNPVEIMSDPAFPKECQFVDINVDNRPGIDIADRKTYVKMTSTVKYDDQMQTYANIRKGRKAYGSNALDNISNIELGIHKRRFPKGVDVTNACIVDYWDFVLYNINDVWNQFLIDSVTSDLYSLIVDSNQSQCPIENLTKQTRYNKQIYYTEYLRYEVVPGSNINNDYIRQRTDENGDMLREIENAAKRRAMRDKMIERGEIASEDEVDNAELDERLAIEDIADKIGNIYEDSIDRAIRLQGAIVGHPNLNSRNGMELVDGIQSKHVFDDPMDSDFAAEYPWEKYVRSISRSTQYGRLIIPKKISDRQNEYDFPNYIPGAEFTSDYISHDFVSMGNVWFNLPTSDEVADMIKRKKGITA